MAIVQKINVLGMRRFNDAVEGKTYNFTKVSLQMPISSRNENAMGCDAVECVFGDASMFEKYSNLRGKLPMVADVELEMTTKGYEIISMTFPKA